MGFVNPFLSQHVPEDLWPALISEFGKPGDYLPDFDITQQQTITMIWEEGVDPEDTSPGRYTHALVHNSDLDQPPKKGDVVRNEGREYDVVRVDAYLTGYSRITLQDRMENL